MVVLLHGDMFKSWINFESRNLKYAIQCHLVLPQLWHNYGLSPRSCRKTVLATQHLSKGLTISITGKHFWSPTKSHHYCVFVSLGFIFFHKVLDSWLRISSTWHVSNHNSFIPGLDLSNKSYWWCLFPGSFSILCFQSVI